MANTDPGECTSSSVTWTDPTATDASCTHTLPVADYTPEIAFAIGETTVTYTSTDIHGNVAMDSFTITINGQC